MIEINLSPGTGKKKSSRGGGGGGPKMNLGTSFGGFSKSVKDKFLAAAVLAVVIGLGAIASLYTTQTARASALQERLDKAVEDSTHYAAVVADQIKVEAKRDTLLRDINLIKSIDADRFVWPHILDEVSKALPQYTWITNLGYAGTPQGASAAPTGPQQPGAPKPATDSASLGKKKSKKIQTEIVPDTIHIRMIGMTVDIQALTRFMRQLEASPFLADVQLEKSELALADGKEVTQFTLNATYSRPDTSMLNRVPLSVSVR